jgi:hypothetical protein
MLLRDILLGLAIGLATSVAILLIALAAGALIWSPP